MKRIVFIILLILAGSCEKPDIETLIKRNKSKITIKTGVAGTLLRKEGNCMPGIGGFSSTCKSYPVKRTILIYDATKFDKVQGFGPLFNSVSSNLIAQCDSDQDGFFQATLAPGKYSIFISDSSKFYANLSDGSGIMNPLTIKIDSVSITKQILDYAVY